jgi:hypothetical protein
VRHFMQSCLSSKLSTRTSVTSGFMDTSIWTKPTDPSACLHSAQQQQQQDKCGFKWGHQG